MKISIKELTDSLGIISSIISSDTTTKGAMFKVLLDFTGSRLMLSFTSGRKAVISQVNIKERTEADDNLNVKMAVDFNKFTDILKSCQSSSSIIMEDVEITRNPNALVFKADMLYKDVAGYDEDGSEQFELKKEGEKTMDLGYSTDFSKQSEAILTRFNYDEIFIPAEGIVPDDYATADFAASLSKVIGEKGRMTYLSKQQYAFVSNSSHLVAVPIDGIEGMTGIEPRVNHSVCFPQESVTAVADILGKLNKRGTESVKLYIKDRGCYIYAEDDSFGLWFECATPSSMNINLFDTFMKTDFGDYQFSFKREFLMDMVNSFMRSSKSDKITFGFTVSSDGESNSLFMTASAVNSLASSSDTFKTKVETVNHVMVAEDKTLAEEITGVKFSINAKVMLDILKCMSKDHVAFDLQEKSGYMVRVADIDDEAYMESCNRNRTEEGWNISGLIAERKDVIKTLCFTQAQMVKA